MSAEVWWIALASFVMSLLLTGVARRLALAKGVIDIPNARSSHTIPTPRGGGISIVLVVLGALAVLTFRNLVDMALFLALIGGGAAVAIVGYIDDRRGVAPSIRLAVHFAAAVWAMLSLGDLPVIHFGEHSIRFGWEGYLVGALGIVWVLNLFNFMDGIDGIAGAEGVFVSCSAAALTVVSGSGAGVGAASLILGMACAGFLIWNLPPAKIFMGDIGSGFLGYTIAVLAIALTRNNPIGLLVCLILGGAFFVDATVTFIRRLARGERVYEAHRSHAYQWLARRWQSHGRVTAVVAILNVLWLLPWASFAVWCPVYAAWALVAALVPIVVGVLVAGAGRREVQVV